MVLDRQKVLTDGRTDGRNGRTDGRTHGQRQNNIPPTSSGDKNLLVQAIVYLSKESFTSLKQKISLYLTVLQDYINS